MAHETILVVDDAAVNLKLTDILLRKEGYKVHTTSDAEQALSLLRSLHPDLMLVDIQLPGMNGLELTRRVKQDATTKDIIVVALTATAMDGEDNEAFRAGCDGYIAKPIETLALAKKVRQFLDARTAAEAAALAPPSDAGGVPAGIVLSPAELEGVRRRFLEEGLLQSRNLLETMDRNIDLSLSARMAREWREAARFLEYPAIEILSAEAENLLRVRVPEPIQLREALSNVMLAFAEPPEAAMGPIPDTIATSLKDRSIALIGCGEEEAERLCGALERAGARPRLFNANGTTDSEPVGVCHAVVIHVRSGTLGTHWLHPLTVAQLQPPLMLMGMRDSILELDTSVTLQASELLIDGWQPEEALIRLSHALARRAAAPVAAEPAKSTLDFTMPREISRNAEVLIADDDLTVRMLVRSAVQAGGIKCRMACNGTEAIQMIRDTRPPAAILDVNMPGMDGYEVLAQIRKERLPVRVILLTARQQEADIARAFSLGADDYVVKPFNLEELLARLKRFLWE